MKPAFNVDFSPAAPSPLAAHALLAAPPIAPTRHQSAGLREPLGIYNVSVARVAQKVLRLGEKLEAYFNRGEVVLEPSATTSAELSGVTDYVELLLYAAAEHVDDIDAIATGYFASPHVAGKSPAYRELQKAVKSTKRFLSTAANSIKHQQARIRVYSLAYQQGVVRGVLHGYFVEGVSDGVVGPSGPLHDQQAVYSITALLWEVLWFVLTCSSHLATFLRGIVQPATLPVPECSAFAKAVEAAARLPNYTFGECHPFERTTFVLTGSEGGRLNIDSGLHGSLGTPWDRHAPLQFGSYSTSYEGDGSSRSFQSVAPRSVVLHHWD
jgi:hypothetical protein